MAGVDGVKNKGFMMILNAKNMKPEFHATAPELSLFGIHNGFFDFNVGCSDPAGCVPKVPSSAGRPVFATMLVAVALFFFKMF